MKLLYFGRALGHEIFTHACVSASCFAHVAAAKNSNKLITAALNYRVITAQHWWAKSSNHMCNFTPSHLVLSKLPQWSSEGIVGSKLWSEGAKHTTHLPKWMHVIRNSEYHESIKSVWLKQTAELRTGESGGHSLTLTKVEVWLNKYLHAKEAGKSPLPVTGAQNRVTQHWKFSLGWNGSLCGTVGQERWKTLKKQQSSALSTTGCFGDRNQPCHVNDSVFHLQPLTQQKV